jgi:uncharacterized ferritin-like protein (DUF455 family)
MIAREALKTQVLVEGDVWRKLAILEPTLRESLRGAAITVPVTPGRDVQILPIRQLPAKKGLSTKEGQARLLHDLASIELQAMELGVRTLAEYPDAPAGFREELCEVTMEEGKHLRLCLEGLNDLGFPWGTFAAHTGLWQCVAATDSLLDRIVLVHRYLEGSGLDASETLLRRLKGVQAPEATRAVEVIGRDEVGHVQFGSRWYRQIVKDQGLDPEVDFKSRLNDLFARIPRRLEPINAPLRELAGFSLSEIEVLQDIRARLSQTSHSASGSATGLPPISPA